MKTTSKIVVALILCAILVVAAMPALAKGQSNFCAADDVLSFNLGSQRSFARCTDGADPYLQYWRIICVGTFSTVYTAEGAYVSCVK